MLAGWDAEAPLCLDLQKNQKCFVSWLSGPHGTSNFDHQSLIHSDLNYTNIANCLQLILLPSLDSLELNIKLQLFSKCLNNEAI